MQPQRIMVIDDEPAIRDMINTILEISGYQCLQAENAQQAFAMIIDESPDLILLDWMMPETSGIELLRRLRRNNTIAQLPVIMLTAKAAEDNLIQGLEVGADDYIMKPFSPRELIARIKSLLRRTQLQENEEILTAGKLVLDPASHRVSIGEVPVALGPTEYRLLHFFLTHQERVYSRDQLLDYVWGENVYMDERTVDVHIRRLRKALAADNHDRFVQTVRGTGYRFSTKAADTGTG